MNRKILLLLTFMLLLPGLLSAAITGKIKGKVTDKETGDALPGANIMILETTMGAATDINGDFIILNIPVGVYKLQANFIGYKDVRIANIKVVSDLTTEVNFELPSEALAGETVTIIAERPLVNKNATNALRVQSYEEFKNVPVRDATTIIALQPGVVIQNGDLYVRGGRRDEVGYFLEGASVRDIFDGRNKTTIIPEALEEFQLQAGGYTAQYGGANAGIVSGTFRSGTSNYRFTVQAETDNFAAYGEKFLDTYSYQYSDYTVTASGPVPYTKNKLNFFFAGQNTYQGDAEVRFWSGFDFNHAESYTDANNFPIVTTNFNDTLAQGLHMNSGNIPQANSNRWVGSGTLTYDANPLKFRLSTNLSLDNFDRVENHSNRIELFNLHRIDQYDESSGLVNFKFSHILNPRTFYEVNLNMYDYRRKRYDSFFKDNFWAYYDSLENVSEGMSFKDWETGNVGNAVDIYGFDFTRPNTPADYEKIKRSYMGGAINLVTQYKAHEIRVGGDYQRHTVRYYYAEPDRLWQNMISNPDQYQKALDGDPTSVGAYRLATRTNNYGYDIWGNEINDNEFGLDGPKHPQHGSFYVQDKFEAKQLVINAGLRLDYIDNDDFHFEDPNNPDWDFEGHNLLTGDLKEKDPFIGVSPRLGLAFPATDRTVFHIQYGKFIQAPKMEDLYQGQYRYDQLFTGGFAFLEPTGFGLDPQKTTQYEIGFNYQFADNASFDITAFYKDIQDWITTGRVLGDPTSRISYYNVLLNGDFATTKGLEFSLTLRRTNRVQAQINYTFSSSLGTGSAPLTSIAGTEQGTNVPTIINPMDFHHPHLGTVNFDYRFNKGDGGPVFEQLGLNLLMNFSSGHPYTLREGSFGQQDADYGGVIEDPRNRVPREAINTSMTPWNYDISLRLDKTVDFGMFNANFYVYVQNLTNRQNITNVFDRTGNPWDDGFKALNETSGPIASANGGATYWHLYDAINLSGNGENYTREFTDQLLFGHPRQIRVGVRLEY